MNDTANNSPENSPEDSPPVCLHCGLPVPRSRRKRSDESASFCCMGCHLVHQIVRAGEDDSQATATSPFLLRLGLGIFLAMNIMAFSGFFYGQQVYDAAGEMTSSVSLLASLFSYLLLLLCTLVVVLLGGPLLGEAISSLHVISRRDGQRRLALRIDVNLLILVGVITAYGLSAVNTLRGQGHLYYDTAAMILVLVTLGGYLDARAKRKAASSSEALLASLPAKIYRRETDGTISELNVDEVATGDVIRIRPGETIAIDGVIIEGSSFIDESVLTGESRSRSASLGDQVLAGAMNLDGLLWVQTTMEPGHRVIDQARELLDEARRTQPAIQRVADRVAAAFVPLVIALAIVVFAWHATSGEAETGLFTALSVLLISCPCALGLAAPLACYHALTRAARHGILIQSPVTLEKLAAVRSIIFDKTGTLTRGTMRVEEIACAAGTDSSHALALAAALESVAHHPIAQAIITHAASHHITIPHASDLHLLPGRGVQGNIAGVHLHMGNEALARECGCAADPLMQLSESSTDVFLIRDQRILARFRLADVTRSESPAVISSLTSQGMNISVLSGDQSGPVQRLARELNIQATHGLLPADKMKHLQQQRKDQSRRIAFVGDGINDAPVMAAADVGIAIGNATDMAKQAGQVHLIGEGLGRLPLVFEIARDAVRKVRLNLLWAFGYNAIGLTLAVMGLLTPIFAASSMVVSSLLIVVTSSQAKAELTSMNQLPPVPEKQAKSNLTNAVVSAT